jgi:hypothetical protein
MAKFTDYTEKTEPVDTDLALIYDTPAKVNKKFTFGNLWKWIAKKIVSEGISQLDTTNKTIPGAINELNSNLLKIQTGPNERSIVVNVFDGDYIGGSFLLFGRSNPNDLTAAVFTCFRSKKSDDVKAKILALDGATYNTVADNKSVTITGSRITPYSTFALLSADAFSQTFIQIK